MEHKCYKPVKLFDVTMYGGDSTPWEFSLVRKNGSNFPVDEGTECTATLTIVPFDTVASPVGYINTNQAVLQKTATFKVDSTGNTVAVFYFEENDTKSLYGKFAYQVEVRHKDNVRIGQGELVILYNINYGGMAE